MVLEDTSFRSSSLWWGHPWLSGSVAEGDKSMD